MPSSRPQRLRGRDERGAVFVEKLIVYLPLLLTFFVTWELAELGAAKLVVQRASAAAGRAAVVVLPDDPVYYDGEAVHSFSGQRRADIELAAGMVLSAIPRLRADFDLQVSEATEAGEPLEVTLTAPYDCGPVSVFCSNGESFALSAVTTHTYQGAKYQFTTTADVGSGAAALTKTGEEGPRLRTRYQGGNQHPQDAHNGCQCTGTGRPSCPLHGFPGLPFATPAALACAQQVQAAITTANGTVQSRFKNKALSVIILDDGSCYVGLSGTKDAEMAALERRINIPNVHVPTHATQAVKDAWCRDNMPERTPGQCAEAKLPGNLPAGRTPVGTFTWWSGGAASNNFAYPGRNFGNLSAMTPCQACQDNGQNYNDNMRR